MRAYGWSVLVLGALVMGPGPLARAHDPPTIVRHERPIVIRVATAHDGGPVAVEETTVFEATDPKVVAWARFLTTGPLRVVFRWSAPSREVQRVSPPRLLSRGEQAAWDELPIRDSPAAGSPGIWTVEVFANNRLSAVAQFRILPPQMQTVWRAGWDTTTLAVALVALWTTTRADALAAESTFQRGVEVTYRFSPIVTFRALTQWRDHSAGGVFRAASHPESSYGVDVSLRGGLTVGLGLTPRTATQGNGTEGTQVVTAHVTFAPSARVLLTALYTGSQPGSGGLGPFADVVTLSLRYAPNTSTSYHLTATITDVRLPALPDATTSSASIHLSTTIRF